MSTNVSKTKSNLIEGQNTLMSYELSLLLLDCSGSMSNGLPAVSEDDFEIDEDLELTDEEMAEMMAKKQAQLDAWVEANYHGYKSKMTALKEAVVKYVRDRATAVEAGSQDRVGVITFNSEAKLMWDLNRKNFDVLIDKIWKLYATGGTDMAGAVQEAMSVFERYSEGFFRIVIVTDGQDSWKDYTYGKVKTAFEELGIITDTIGIGNDCDETFLKSLAEVGGGEFTKINSYKALLGTFETIQSERQKLLGDGIRLLGPSTADNNTEESK